MSSKHDPVLWMLFAGIWMSVALLFVCSIFLKDNRELFSTLSGSLFGGFVGTFFQRIRPDQPGDAIEHPKSVVTSTAVTAQPEAKP